jgi:MSHA biogenesis protein MshO
MHRGRGFTLLEMVVTLSVLGIVAGMLAVFVRAPIQAYADTSRRVALADLADATLQRMSRELRTALPNSIRVTAAGTAVYLEFIATSGVGRYRAALAGDGSGNLLDFTGADTSFDILGPIPDVPAGSALVVMNLGSGSDADAYAGSNRAAITGLSGSVLSFSSFLFPYDAPSRRFFVATGPLTYVCDTATATLYRISGYAYAASQPTPPVGGSSALLVDQVAGCSFSFDALASRSGMLSMSLSLASGAESIRLFRQLAVDNAP